MALGRTEAYEEPARPVAVPATAGPSPRARITALTFAVGALVVLPALVVGARLVAVVVGGAAGRYPAALLVLLSLFGCAVARAFAGYRWGTTRLTPQQARELRKLHTASAWQAADPTLVFDATSSGISYRVEPAAAVLPELEELAGRVARDLGVPVLPVDLVRSGPSVWRSEDGARLRVSTTMLLVASAEELVAAIAYELAPLQYGSVLRQLSRARLAGTAADPGGAVFGGLGDLPWRPARWLAGHLERDGQRLAAELHAACAHAADRLAGPAVTERVLAMQHVGSELWREHLGVAQRGWTTSGTELQPHVTFAAAWDAAVGRTLKPRAADRGEATRRVGWPQPIEPTVVGVRGWPCALELLAGERGPQVLQRFDEGVAAQFRDEGMLDHLGPALVPAVDEPASPVALGAPAQSAPSAPAEAHAAFVAELPATTGSPWQRLFPELDALGHARMRRDPQALALAQQLDRPDALPLVRATAASVRWMCGDPGGVHAIERCLADVPRSVVVFQPLAASLRTAGAAALAAAIEQCFAEFVAAPDGADLNLSKMWGRGARLEAAVWPPAVRSAIAERVAAEPGVTGAWLVVARSGEPTRFDPPVLAVRTGLLSLERYTRSRGSRLTDDLALILPGLVVATWDEIEGRRRSRLKRHLGSARVDR